MKLFDSHCHLNHDDFSGYQLNEAYENAQSNDVQKIMVPAFDEPSSIRAVEIANEYKTIHAAVGVHPHYVLECSDEIIERLKRLTRQKCVQAWGEIGLDFFRMLSPQKDQEFWFLKQLKTADELSLPLIFHERDSNGRLVALLKENPNPKRKAVVHCFSGNHSDLESYLEMGFYIGITGILTIKSRGKFLRSIVKDIPLDKILIETDAPYLIPAPEKNKKRRNEPAFVKSVLLKLSDILEIDPPKLSEITYDNASRLFERKE